MGTKITYHLTQKRWEIVKLLPNSTRIIAEKLNTKPVLINSILIKLKHLGIVNNKDAIWRLTVDKSELKVKTPKP